MFDWLRRRPSRPSPARAEVPPAPLERKVLVITYAPLVRDSTGERRKLWQTLNWNNPVDLVRQYIEDVRECSHGLVHYTVAEQQEAAHFPVKQDGFSYTAESYLANLQANGNWHQPDAVDYLRILDEFDVVTKTNSGTIDEVWLFGFPYAGYYESRMAGPGAIWCNAPPLDKVPGCRRRFVLMGFNYERGVGEMLENLGHRAESILAHVFGSRRGADNLWELFTRYDLTHPGRAEVGTMHFAPNSQHDYDWGNLRGVPSGCDDWLDFPAMLSGGERLQRNPPRIVDAREWGLGDTRRHHLWWFRHLPHTAGIYKGRLNNWWEYFISVDGEAPAQYI